METPITIRIKRRSPSPAAYDPSADLAEALRIYTEMNEIMDKCEAQVIKPTVFTSRIKGESVFNPTEEQKVALRRLHKEWCAIVPKMENYNKGHGITCTVAQTVGAHYKQKTGKMGFIFNYSVL
jgi:hypothetical protein